MTEQQDTNTSPELKGWRKYLQVRISRWDATISYTASFFFIFVLLRILLGDEDFNWITWVDALQTGLLCGILGVVFSLHYKLVDTNQDK